MLGVCVVGRWWPGCGSRAASQRLSHRQQTIHNIHFFLRLKLPDQINSAPPIFMETRLPRSTTSVTSFSPRDFISPPLFTIFLFLVILPDFTSCLASRWISTVVRFLLSPFVFALSEAASWLPVWSSGGGAWLNCSNVAA